MFIVTGCPRSGTTYIQRILNANKHVLCLHESGILCSSRQRLQYLENEEVFQSILKEKGITWDNFSIGWPNINWSGVLVDKYPYYAKTLDKVNADHIILCVRNPIDTYLSIIYKLGWSANFALKEMEEHYQGILKNIDDKAHTVIKQENIIQDKFLLHSLLENALQTTLNINIAESQVETYSYNIDIVNRLNTPIINKFRERFQYESC